MPNSHADSCEIPCLYATQRFVAVCKLPETSLYSKSDESSTIPRT